ncbi:Ras-related protein RABH1b [Zea mays]|uniref:Ras-related protein RABH1b n=2 Tax=Zea mays TaxID=4577 RepID=A0A1D6J0L6_MAIZE|nr:Ras-related protein RABH1b [Zea mays]AQK41598.1 Ras-related protein RABH1b [Zea mays]AQK41610.1 Ras-related protein RABH1b [Zea mays]
MEPHHGTRTAISTTDLRARLPQLAPLRHCERRWAQPPLHRVGPPASVAVPPPPTTATGPATDGRRVPRIYWVIGSICRSATASSCHVSLVPTDVESDVSIGEIQLLDFGSPIYLLSPVAASLQPPCARDHTSFFLHF